MNFDITTILSLLKECFGAEFSEDGDKFSGMIKTYDFQGNLFLAKDKLNEIISILSSTDLASEVALLYGNTYEILVREEASSPMMRHLGRRDDIRIEDIENKYLYKISSISPVYFIFMLSQLDDVRLLRRSVLFGLRRHAHNDSDNTEDIDIFNLLENTHWYSAKIETPQKQTHAEFEVLLNSFLFQIAYNMDWSIVPIKYWTQLSMNRFSGRRRQSISEMSPPLRTYNVDLVQHYLLAVSTDNPVIEYLSYYHIIEHFYDDAFNEDLINQIKSQITSPAFSYKRKNDIKVLVKFIVKSVKVRDEAIVAFDEKNALLLCLKKYVDISDLKNSLNNVDSTLISYYENTSVPFSGGACVDFNKENDVILKQLQDRIYSTRNSLVHSKDGIKSKYVPFRDDNMLIKEVPLLKFISESVILQESKIL